MTDIDPNLILDVPDDDDGNYAAYVAIEKWYPYPARAGSATAAGGRRMRLAPPGMVPALS
jgi:hypothetical protein